MKRPLIALILLLTWSQALASPAQDLFNQASYYLAFYYNGYSNADWSNFSAQFQPEIDGACQSQLENCPYSAAVPVIKKMFDALQDGHSYYLSAQEVFENSQRRNGQSSSNLRIGISSLEVPNSSERVITDVQADGPAERSGMQRGDRVVALNNQAASTFGTGNDFWKAVTLAVRSGKAFKLTVLRGAKNLELTLRGETHGPPLPSLRTLAGGVGLLRIPTFEVYGAVGQITHDLVSRAARQKLRALIVDVRDNPGGIDVEFIASLAAFVPKAGYKLQSRAVTSSKVWVDSGVFVGDPNGSPLLRVQLLRNASLWKGRMVVLTNANSYSGAEYFAQGIQDAKRGLVIGEVTGGLGNTVTVNYDLQDGGAVAITFAKSLRLDDTPLPERVEPDVLLKDDLEVLASTGRDLVLERALEELNSR